MNHRISILLIPVLAFIAPSPTVHAQDPAGNPCTAALPVVDPAGPWAVQLRLRQLQGSAPLSALTIRRPSSERRITFCDPGQGVVSSDAPPARFSIRPLPLRLRSSYNTAYPLDVNNGAVWAGRGLSSALSGGVDVRFGAFSAALYPLVAFHENSDFPLAPVAGSYSPYTYAANIIDWTQRYGEDAFWVLDPGQSHMRLDAFGATVGVSTENLWLGPAQRMPLLMGSSAPGFPHAFIGTSRPHDIRIGSIEAQAFWARLTESEYFDGDATNDHTLLAGLSVVFEPAFARGLFIGINRMHLSAWDPDDLSGLIVGPYADVRANSLDNQLLSLYGRWVLPAAGFEAYAEWAREDHWQDWNDLLMEPDHSQVYMLGFQKSGSLGDADLRWFGELAHLESALPLRAGRGVITFYTHSQFKQGFTHRGQLLGAWIGPGSDAQILGVERIDGRRSSGFSIERTRFDDNAYYNRWGRFYGHNGHDVALSGMLRHTEPFGDILVRSMLGVSRRQNRNFINLDGTQPGNFQSETNVRLGLDLVWLPQW